MLPQRVTPLTWTMFWEPCGAAGWQRCFVDRLGFDEGDIPDARSVVALIDGWGYLNASLLREWSSWLPAGVSNLAERLMASPNIDFPQHQPIESSVDAISQGIVSQWFNWVTESGSQAELKANSALSLTCAEKRPNLKRCSDSELVGRATSLQGLARRLFEQHVNQTLAASVGPALIEETGVADEHPAGLLRLLSGIGSVETVALPRAIWELSRMVRSSAELCTLFDQVGRGDWIEALKRLKGPEAVGLLAAIEALAPEVAFRGSNSWELASHGIAEDVSLVLDSLDCLRQLDDSADPISGRPKVESARALLVAAMAANLVGGDRHQFLAGVKSAGVFIRGRELSRTSVLRVLHEMRLPMAELGRRANRRGELEDPDHIWMLNAEEAEYYGDGGMGAIGTLTSERHEAFVGAGGKPAELLAVSSAGPLRPLPGCAPDQTLAPGCLRPGDSLIGVAASPGIASGPARVVGSSDDIGTIRSGEVLVIDRPNLMYASIFPAVAAILADHGHLSSHAVVVAREFGIPVVTGLSSLSTRIANGTVLDVDGLAGVVSVRASREDQGIAATRSPQDQTVIGT